MTGSTERGSIRQDSGRRLNGFGRAWYTRVVCGTYALGPIGATTFRHALYAVCQTAAEGMDPIPAVGWLRGRYPGMEFFDQRQRLVRLLRYLADKPNGERIPHWKRDAEAAHILAARLNDES